MTKQIDVDKWEAPETRDTGALPDDDKLPNPFNYEECPKCGYALIHLHIGKVRKCASLKCDFEGELPLTHKVGVQMVIE